MAHSTIGTMLEVQEEGGKWIEISDVQTIPALGGTPQVIDATNLTDREASSIPGVKQQSDLQIILYMNNSKETDNYRICRRMELSGKVMQYRVTFPDGTRVSFKAVAITSINDVTVNSPQLFTLSLFKRGDFNVANPDGTFVLIDSIEDITLYAGDFDNIFVRTIPADCTVEASVAPEGASIASVAVYGTQLTIQALAKGTAKVTVTAKNGADGESSTSFTVTVNDVVDE